MRSCRASYGGARPLNCGVRRHMKLAVHIALTVLFTIAVMALWMSVAEAIGWRPFVGWAMWHGGFIVAIPVCFVLGNVVAFFAARFAAKRWNGALHRSQRHW